MSEYTWTLSGKELREKRSLTTRKLPSAKKLGDRLKLDRNLSLPKGVEIKEPELKACPGEDGDCPSGGLRALLNGLALAEI